MSRPPAAVLVLMFLALQNQACIFISSAAIVPETAANTNQINTCQSTASLHNGFVIGDFALGGASTRTRERGGLRDGHEHERTRSPTLASVRALRSSSRTTDCQVHVVTNFARTPTAPASSAHCPP